MNRSKESERLSLRIAYLGYRKWSFELLDRLFCDADVGSSIRLVCNAKDYKEEEIDYSKYDNLRHIDPKDKGLLASLFTDHKINLALFYSWSWIVPKSITETIDCICLHPSLLPNYRGGTPFQHQILSGEKEGGLTLFKMNDVIDGGDIVKQRKFSLDGRLSDIFGRIVQCGSDATIELIRDYERGSVEFVKQEDLDQYPAYKRRKPSQSEVLLEDLCDISCVDFYNFVRALDDPYPNCFIRLTNNKTLYIKEVEIVSRIPVGSSLVNSNPEILFDRLYVKLKDGAAHIIRHEVKSTS